MTSTQRRELRIALPHYEAATAWLNDYPGGRLHLVVDEVADAAIEYLVRKVLPPDAHTSPSAAARCIVFCRDANPVGVAARALPGLLDAGVSGLVCLPAVGSAEPPCGWAIVDACGVEGLAAVHIVSPGLRRIDLDWGRAGEVAQPVSAARRLAGLKVAVVGSVADVAVFAEELTHCGAERIEVLAVDADEVKSSVAPPTACRDLLITADRSGVAAIEPKLAECRPDIVVGCGGGSCSSVLARWCQSRLRLFVDVARLRPARIGQVSTCVRALLPCVPAALQEFDEVRSKGQVGLFGQLPIPPRRALDPARQDIEVVLRKHAARAAAQAVARLARGEFPEPVSLTVEVGHDAPMHEQHSDTAGARCLTRPIHATA